MDMWWWLLVAAAVAVEASRDTVVMVNTLRLVTETTDTFLGLSVSPRQLLMDAPYSAATVNMLQGMSPGVLRVGGADAENLAFNTASNSSGTLVFSDAQWSNLNELVANTGLHLVFSLSPKFQNQVQLMNVSANRGYNITWQLGYSVSNDNEINKCLEQMSDEFTSLRRFFDEFPQYYKAVTLGAYWAPCKDLKCDFVQPTNGAIEGVILQIKQQKDMKSYTSMFEELDELSSVVEKFLFNSDLLLRRLKGSTKKHIWVAEAEDTGYNGGVRDAMFLALALGHTSHQGYETFLLHLPQLYQPTPGYWTALLYRALVGQRILESRLWPQKGDLAVFTACTAAEQQTVVDTEWEYNAGAVTVWGVNFATENTHLALRAGSLLEYVHLYVLSEDPNEKGNILLNMQKLQMVHGVLPRLSPRIRIINRGASVTVPAKSVFFIVLPEARAPACFISSSDAFPKFKKEDSSPLVINISTPSSKIQTQATLENKTDDIIFENGGSLLSIKDSSLLNNVRNDDSKYARETKIPKIDASEKNINVKFKQNEQSVKNKYSGDIPKGNESSKQSLFSLDDRNGMTASNMSTSERINNYEIILTGEGENNSRRENIEFTKIEDSSKSSEIAINKNQSDMQTDIINFTRNFSTNNVNPPEQLQIPRIKRSEDIRYFDEPSFRDTETLPLYRRVNLLRQILNKMQQPKLYVDSEADLSKTTETTNPKSKHARYNNKISKSYYPRGGQPQKAEDINYLPGEFYEILGGVKIDSSVPLKEKGENLVATDSVQKQSKVQKCNENERKCKAMENLRNDSQVQNGLVEHENETSKKPYNIIRKYPLDPPVKTNSPDETEEENDHKENVKGETRETEKQAKYKQMGFPEDSEKSKSGDNSMEMELPLKRTSREVKYKEEEDLYESTPQIIKNKEKYSFDYSDEVDLRNYIEKLTSEGEQLLKCIDEECEENIDISSNKSDTTPIFTTEYIPVLLKNNTANSSKIFSEESKSKNTDFYLANNVVVENIEKPKRKYPFQDGELFYYSLNKTTIRPVLNYDDKETINISKTTISPAVWSITFGTDISPSNEVSEPTDMTTLDDGMEGIDNSGLFPNTTISEVSKTTEAVTSFTSDIVLGNNTYNSSNKNNSEKNREFIATNSINASDVLKEDKYVLKKLDFENNKFKETHYIMHEKDLRPSFENGYISYDDISNINTTTGKSFNETEKLDSKKNDINITLSPPLKLPLNTQTVSVPSVLTSNRNLNLLRKIDVIHNRLIEQNSKKQPTFTVEGMSPSLNVRFSNKYKERIEAIKEGLQKARERLLKLSNSKTTPRVIPITPRRSKRDLNILTRLFSLNKINQTKNQSENSNFNSTGDKEALKYQDNFLNKSGTGLNLIDRFARQVIHDETVERSSSKETDFDQFKNGDTTTRAEINSEKQVASNVFTPLYISEIKKWAIPLSNHTENILYKGKYVPINLYGIVSVKWVQANIEPDSHTEIERHSRDLHYPCLRDRYNDFETDTESSKLTKISNLDNGKSPSVQNSKHNKIIYTLSEPELYIKSHSSRSKRSHTEDIKKNEIEMKALLTNEIVKERPSHDVPDHGSVFQTMLHKTLTKAVSNKTGLERMLELAKKYRENEPSSIEIYPTKN